jgi:hypothetical protein
MSLRFRHGTGGKVYSGNVTNGKDFLPIHIAAMSTKCPQNILRILRDDFEQSVYGRTSDGSLPLHLVNIFFDHKNRNVLIQQIFALLRLYNKL